MFKIKIKHIRVTNDGHNDNIHAGYKFKYLYKDFTLI